MADAPIPPTGRRPHSLEPLTKESRNFLWEEDYLQLLARRWKLENVRDALDVGCGMGHWTFSLARVLPAQSRRGASARSGR